MRRWKSTRVAEAVAAALFTLWVTWPYLVPGRPVVSLDGLAYSAPNMRVSLDALGDGRLALWNDAIFGGVPHAGNPQTAAFSPTKLVVLGLDPTRAVNVLTAVHLGVLAAGMMLLCAWRLRLRPPAAFVGCALAVGCGALASKAVQFEQLCVVAWVPLLMALLHWLVNADGPWPAVGCTAIVTALWITAGHPQIIYITAALVVVWTAALVADRRRPLRLLHAGAAASVGALIALPHLVLAARATQHGALTTGRTLADLSRPGFSLLASRVVPALLGDPGADDQAVLAGGFEATTYVGAAGLALALIGTAVGIAARERRWTTFGLAGGALGATVFALGPRTAIFRLAHRIVPGFDLARVPARWVLPASLCLAVLGALGTDAIVRAATPARRARAAMAGSLAAAVLVGVAAMVRYRDVLPRGWTVAWWMFATVVVAAAWLTAASSRNDRRRAPVWRWVMVTCAVVPAVLVSSELGVAARHSFARALQLDRSPEAIDGAVVSYLREHPQGRSVAATFDEFGDPTYLTTALRPNANSLFGIRSADGYDGGVQVTERWVETFGTLLGTFNGELTLRAQLYVPMEPGVWARLGVRYVVVEPRGTPASALLPGWRGPVVDGPLELWENPAWRSDAVAWFASSSAEGAAQAIEALAADPTSGYVQLESDMPTLRCRAATEGCEPVTLAPRRHHSGDVTVTTSFARDAVVVLNEQYDDGWRAEIDGRRVDVMPADAMSIGVVVPAGAHTVRFVYRPASLRPLLGVSLLATAGAVACMVIPVTRRRRAARLAA